MKRLTIVVASAIICASASVSTPLAAQDHGPATPVVEFCAQFGNTINGPGLPTAGSCVSYFRTGGAVAFCKQAKDFGLLEFFGFKSQGECVATLNS